MEIGLLINAFITLLVVIDPPGMAPVFLSLTFGMDKSQRRQTALIASVISLFILLFFAIGGMHILNMLGISLGAFQVAGGILLFATAFEMIFEKRNERKEKTAQVAITHDHIRNIAAFPLAMPLLAGPGAISATILMSSTVSTTWGMLSVLGVIIAAILVCYIILLLAIPIDRFLGDTGRSILSRLFGVILAALAVQFVANGLLALFPNI